MAYIDPDQPREPKNYGTLWNVGLNDELNKAFGRAASEMSDKMYDMIQQRTKQIIQKEIMEEARSNETAIWIAEKTFLAHERGRKQEKNKETTEL
jgi:hypothetical protein